MLTGENERVKLFSESDEEGDKRIAVALNEVKFRHRLS